MATGRFRRIGNTAVPVGKEAREALLAIPDGKDFMGDFRTARNPLQHDLYWALCDLVAETTDSSKRAVSDWLLEKTGFADLVFYPDGTMRVQPRSIAWASMEQIEFNSFFRLAVPKVAELLGAAPPEIWQRFEEMLDPETRATARKRLRKVPSPTTAPAQSELQDERMERANG